MDFQLLPVEEADLEEYKAMAQEAFQKGYGPQIGDIVKVETTDGQWEEFTVMGIGKAPNLGGDSASFYFPQELLPMMKENVSNFNMTCIVDVERDQLTEVENKKIGRAHV